MQPYELVCITHATLPCHASGLSTADFHWRWSRDSQGSRSYSTWAQARGVRTVKPELAVVHTIAAHLVTHILYPDAWHYRHVLHI